MKIPDRFMSSRAVINLLFLCILIGCAKEGMPPGGPVDKEPPVILGTLPEPGMTMVDTTVKVEVFFNEPIQPKTVADAVFITPYMGEDDVQVKSRGKRITVKFKASLSKGRTYVITFGTGIKDYRNNAMESSFTLAFSTGPLIDEGEINGQVLGISEARGIDVWAYRMVDEVEPDPSQFEPDYIVQCETDGRFTFSNLAPGNYRIFSVKDRIADRLYQPVEDEIGVTFYDVLVAREDTAPKTGLTFQMSRADTTGPSIVRGQSQNANHIMLRFDEEVFIGDSTAAIFDIVQESDSTVKLSLSDYYKDPVNPQTYHLYTESQSAGIRYRLTVSNIFDQAGNGVDTAFQRIQFDGVTQTDTVAPRFTKADPSPGSHDVHPSKTVKLYFDEAMDTTRSLEGFVVTDTLSNPVEGTASWVGVTELNFYPQNHFQSLTHYQIQLGGAHFADRAGNLLPDSLVKFQTMNRDTLSSISGSITDPDSMAIGAIHVIARQVEKKDVLYLTNISEPGPYTLDEILPGAYVVECFRDEDGNGRFSFGVPFPFKPSERFIVYSDTIEVRSRWPNEGNDIILP